MRDESTGQLFATLHEVLAPRQRTILQMLLDGPEVDVYDLERGRKVPVAASGKKLKTLVRASEFRRRARLPVPGKSAFRHALMA
ncbi:hypothetical protein ACIBH1_44945 [Nonomuraea sp. NPDC050663]|uniref:hypothetical protein n=1 Tax=Nonomuraea sp. NPDC050663 TaxID=3364370 RepID=UPI00379C8CF8